MNAATYPFTSSSLAPGCMVAEANSQTAEKKPENNQAMDAGKMKDGYCSADKK